MDETIQMEIAKFLKMLARRWYILIAVPLISILCTYLLVQNMQNSYRSEAKIAIDLAHETPQVQTIQTAYQEPVYYHLLF